jgi:hypothetical protein
MTRPRLVRPRSSTPSTAWRPFGPWELAPSPWLGSPLIGSTPSDAMPPRCGLRRLPGCPTIDAPPRSSPSPAQSRRMTPLMSSISCSQTSLQRPLSMANKRDSGRSVTLTRPPSACGRPARSCSMRRLPTCRSAQPSLRTCPAPSWPTLWPRSAPSRARLTITIIRNSWSNISACGASCRRSCGLLSFTACRQASPYWTPSSSWPPWMPAVHLPCATRPATSCPGPGAG